MDKLSQFFKGYDYVDNPTGPGVGVYNDMKKNKSIKDFLKNKRKLRRKILRSLAQNQFKLDDTLTGLPANESVYLNSVQIGGNSDYSTVNQPNIEQAKGLSGDYLFNGRKDYYQEFPVGEKMLDDFISPEESHLYGLNREHDIEDIEITYQPTKQKYNETDINKETFKDIKPYP